MTGHGRLQYWRSRLGDQPEWGRSDFDDGDWEEVEVPHNWEQYHGYRVVSHGNLHGTAWYRTSFAWTPERASSRLYAFFEGVGSYARVFCNGDFVGAHAGGRTTFTLDLTPALRLGPNLLAVRVDHPPGIDDLPFVCGGCWGSPISEGSQPFGIFRPCSLEETGPVRVEPFGAHVLTRVASREFCHIEARLEIRNADSVGHAGFVHLEMIDPSGARISLESAPLSMEAGSVVTLTHHFPRLDNPQLWESRSPSLYKLVCSVETEGVSSHRCETEFGVRWLTWPKIAEPEADWNVVSPRSARPDDLLWSNRADCSK